MEKIKNLRISRLADANPRPHLAVHWFHYLRISPSYLMARDYKNGKLSKSKVKYFPKDFEKVLQTYDDWGDVWATDYPTWAKDKWRLLFDANIQPPQVRTLAHLLEGEHDTTGMIEKNIQRYLQIERPKTGYPRAFILAIPANTTKKRILSEVNLALDLYKKSQGKDPAPQFVPKAKYSCLVTKVRDSALKNNYQTVMSKALNPGMTLWEISIDLKLNRAATDRIIKATTYLKEAKKKGMIIRLADRPTLDKQLVNAVMGRYIRGAFILAENAARGRFPCIDEIYDELGKKVKTHFDYETIQGLNAISRQQKEN